MIVQISRSDYVSLESFPLAWRWTQSTHSVLPASVLQRVHPLHPERAAQVNSVLVKRCVASRTGGQVIDAGGTPQRVQSALASLLPTPATPVVISWSDELALVTDWDIFVEYWEDFCYPSSDDITIAPLSGDWSLCYYHYEEFRFWARDLSTV